MTRVLIVEDEPRLCTDLVDFLTIAGFEASSVATAQALRQALHDGAQPDIIVLDVGLPDGNGFDLAVVIRNTLDCGIIMLTALGDSAARVRGYESGADIYLVKHSTLREIEAAINSLLRRTGGSAETATAETWVLDTTNWTLHAPNHHMLKLTATEFAFLRELCRHCGEVCERDALVAQLARPKTSFDNRHLDAVVNRLRRKLETATQLEAPIKVVYGVGYTFTGTAVLR